MNRIVELWKRITTTAKQREEAEEARKHEASVVQYHKRLNLDRMRHLERLKLLQRAGKSEEYEQQVEGLVEPIRKAAEAQDIQAFGKLRDQQLDAMREYWAAEYQLCRVTAKLKAVEKEMKLP